MLDAQILKKQSSPSTHWHHLDLHVQAMYIAHELGHVLGLYHEHSRPDRDLHVRVHAENIVESSMASFARLDPQDIDIESTPYDLDSIMHYGPLASAI